MAYIGNQPFTTAFLTDQFSGNGSTTAFTLSAAPANTNSLLVAITGVLQDPSTYSVAGTTLTFSAAPPSGTGNISVRFLGIPASGVVTTAYRTLTEFTATAGQTTFTPPSYTVGYINVFRNGVMLGTADYTASNGTTVVLASAASAGDLVVTESFYVSSVLNALPTSGGTLSGALIVPNFTYTGTLTGSTSVLNIGSGQIYKDASGNVGIGTSSPGAKLEISGGTLLFPNNQFLQQKDSSGNAKNIFGANSSNEVNIGGVDGSSPFATIRLFTGGSERARIDSSGRFGLGVSPSYPIQATLANASDWFAFFTNSSGTAPYGLVMKYSGASPNGTASSFYLGSDSTATRFEVRSNGGIANYSANNVNLSDRREKTNFAPAGSYLPKICAIPVQTFNYIDQNMEEDPGETLGVVAQDVQAVAPELVMESNWGTAEEPKMRLSIYQTDLQYALMKCIQEQQALINDLTARIAALENKA